MTTDHRPPPPSKPAAPPKPGAVPLPYWRRPWWRLLRVALQEIDYVVGNELELDSVDTTRIRGILHGVLSSPVPRCSTPVVVEMAVPYWRTPDGTWHAVSETIDHETLCDRQQAAAEVEETRTRRAWTAALRYAAAAVVLNPSESAAVLNRADRIEAGELTPWAETAPETAPTSTESAEPAPAPTHGPRDAPRGSQGAVGDGWSREAIRATIRTLDQLGLVGRARSNQMRSLLAHAEATDSALADARTELNQRGAAITQADQTRRDLVAKLATARREGAADALDWAAERGAGLLASPWFENAAANLRDMAAGVRAGRTVPTTTETTDG